jgi:hypothetical protein
MPDPRAPSPTDDELDMMLADGRLGGAAKERVLRRRGEPGAAAAQGRFTPAGVPGRGPAGRWRGGGPAARASYRQRLQRQGGSRRRRSRPGDLLRRRIAGRLPRGIAADLRGGGATSGYLAAYADPAGGGERIWYFSADGQSPALAPVAGTQVARKAILLGHEHVLGDYLVHVLVTARPLSRAELGQVPAVIAQRQFSLHVVGGGLVAPL